MNKLLGSAIASGALIIGAGNTAQAQEQPQETTTTTNYETCDPNTWEQRVDENGYTSYYDTTTGELCAEIGVTLGPNENPNFVPENEQTQVLGNTIERSEYNKELARTGNHTEELIKIGAGLILFGAGLEILRISNSERLKTSSDK